MGSSNELDDFFTETDKMVLELLSGVSVNQTVGQRKGSMVLTRVYRNAHMFELEAGVRQALRTLGMRYKTSDGIERAAFAVIADAGRANEIYSGLDKDGWLLEGVRKKPSKAVAYEDLRDIPCLVFLCQRGRMGDTFPPSLSILDFRIRSGGCYSTFIQEMGRACRYVQPLQGHPGFVLSANDLVLSKDAIQARFGDRSYVVYDDEDEVVHKCGRISQYILRQCKVGYLVRPLMHRFPVCIISDRIAKVINEAALLQGWVKLAEDREKLGPAWGMAHCLGMKSTDQMTFPDTLFDQRLDLLQESREKFLCTSSTQVANINPLHSYERFTTNLTSRMDSSRGSRGHYDQENSEKIKNRFVLHA